MTAVSSERVRALLTPVTHRLGVDLEGVTVRKAGRRSSIVITVDKDGGVDLDAIAEIAREVSDALDQADVGGDSPYVLEVSSPGVDRPLTLPRHWRRATNRLVSANMIDGSTIVGRIVGADDRGAVIDTVKGPRDVAFADVTKAVVQVEFSRMDKERDTGPEVG